jgi:simple sugar transport system ATP-binding protein
MTERIEMNPVVKVDELVKKFGPFTALNGVSLEVYPGEIHALLGDNGAGKSTLIKLLSGMFTPTSGQIVVDGQPVHFHTPRDAAAAGIGTVYQDLALVPLMSVSRNFFMGRELTIGPPALGILDTKRMDEIAIEQMGKIGIKFSDPRQTVATMSGGQRQTLAIARAIYFGARVLILDEPTSALGQKQQMEVLKTMVRVRARGDVAIIFITHNEVHAQLVSDRFTFLSLGEIIGAGTKADLEHEEIRHLMAGGTKMADLKQEIAAILPAQQSHRFRSYLPEETGKQK